MPEGNAGISREIVEQEIGNRLMGRISCMIKEGHRK
jgi:hypothetical protein